MAAKYSYKASGVDINLESKGVSELIHQLSYHRQDNYKMIGNLGNFSGLIDFGSKVLAMCTDGVGTKMEVANDLNNWSTVGIDCIAMNVNDMYVMNIEPIAFVDYIATEKINPDQMKQIGIGLNKGAEISNINIVGGETATLKDIITGIDLAGTCVGVQDKNKVITGEKIVPNDIIIGVASTGIHSNGYTLARKIVNEMGDYTEKLPSGKTIGESLLTPTRIYNEVINVCKQVEVHGMCHITGGGLLNFLRITNYGFSIDNPMPIPEILQWIAKKGELDTIELYKTFNMGMGYAYVVPPSSVNKILSLVPDSKIVGKIIPNHEVLLDGCPIT